MKHRTIRRACFALWALSLLGGCVASVPPAFPKKNARTIWIRGVLTQNQDPVVCHLFQEPCRDVLLGWSSDGPIIVATEISTVSSSLTLDRIGLTLGKQFSWRGIPTVGMIHLWPLARIDGTHWLIGLTYEVLFHQTGFLQIIGYEDLRWSLLKAAGGEEIARGWQNTTGIRIVRLPLFFGVMVKQYRVRWFGESNTAHWMLTLEGGITIQTPPKGEQK